MEELTPIEELEYKIEDIGYEINDYLKKKGWKYSSSYPGSYWLWSNADFKGVSRDIAIQMQKHADQMEKVI